MKETVVGINKLLKRVTVIAGIMTVLIFSSCKDVFDKNDFDILSGQPGMAKVTISVMNNNGRTVLPIMPDLSEITKFDLLGKKSNAPVESLLAELSTLDTSFYLETGEWNFTLNAYKDTELILQGKIENTVIGEGENELNFKLSSVNSESGKGNIEITFTFPASAGVTLVNISSDKPGIPDIQEPLDITIDTGATKYTFSKNNVPSGDYFISFKFFNGTTQLRVVSELVLVRNSLTSKKTIQPFAVTVPGITLAEKLAYINGIEGKKDGDEYIIKLNQDESFGGYTLYYGAKKVSITLTGDTQMRTVSLSDQGALFTVKENVTFTLDKNVTLKGSNDNSNPLVVVDRDGTFTMNGGEISGNITVLGATGGGVAVGNYATFIMSGGKISGNTGGFSGSGGGVVVSNNGTFIMNGGEISGNTARGSGGGVYLGYSATFTMEGGEISGNTAQYGGAVCMNSDKFLNMYSTFTMKGGKISGNTAQYEGGGAYVSGIFNMIDGEISGNIANGGGGVSVYMDGTFTMSGGKITGNNATEENWNGSGVRVINSGIFNMNGGEISGNTSYWGGGGVYVDESSTFTMSNGEISDNIAKGGGGVWVEGTFTMTDGKITGNNADWNGGGVWVEYGTFNMNGGEISGNTSNWGGGGVLVKGDGNYYPSGGSFNKTGGTITGKNSPNSNVIINDAKGTAILVQYNDNNAVCFRENTAEPNINLSYDGYGNYDGGWDQ